MLATFLIVFREVIEAGLVVGIIMAATRHVPRRGWWVGYGIAGGVLGACMVAMFAGSIGSAMEGVGQEMFNAMVLLAAVLMLSWHNVWMARHGREIAFHVKTIGEAVAVGKRSLLALSMVAGLAVLREGSEVVLFLYGIVLSGSESAWTMATGGALGLVLGVALGASTYFGLLHVPNHRLFAVTGWLIALLAAGMAAQAVAFLQQAQIITVFTDVIWDSSSFLSDGSIAGTTLHTLVGYTAQPTGMQLIVYVATLVVIFTLMRLFGHVPTPQKTQAAATP